MWSDDGPPDRPQDRSEDEQERLNRQTMSACHRLMLEQHDKPSIIHIVTAQMIAGLCALALAMNGAVVLVTDGLFEAGTVTITLILMAGLYPTLWFGFPLVRRAQK